MKENKIEKLILDLSNRWECTPQEAVDRLNSMNESEINKLINSMTKKFKNGGFIDCLRAGGTIPECKCGKKIGVEKAFFGKKLNSYTPSMTQEGGTFSRMDALNMLRSTGSTNKESRQEYRAAKRDARAAGLRGNEMRQAARSSMMERGANRILPALDDGSGLTIEDPTIEFNDSFQTLNYEQPVVQPMQYQSYGDALANARKKGLDKFYWTDPTGKNSGWKSTATIDDDPIQYRHGQARTPEQQARKAANDAYNGYLNGTLQGSMYWKGYNK